MSDIIKLVFAVFCIIAFVVAAMWLIPYCAHQLVDVAIDGWRSAS